MTVALRYVARCVVEPATQVAPTVQLESVLGGSAQLSGRLPNLPPTGQNRFKPGDVLFSKLRPYLAKSLLVDRPLQGTGEFLCLRPSAELDSRYLKYVTLSHPWLEHAGMGSYGTKMPRTSWEQMSAYRLPVMPLQEQRRVADFLDDRVSRIDRIITARQEQIEAVSALEQSLLARALVHRDDALAPLRRLAITVTTGPFGTVFAASDYVDGGVPMINPSHVKNGLIFPDPQHSVSPETALRLARHQLRDGDLVVSRKGDIGRTAMIGPEQDGWICGSDSIALHAEKSGVLPELLDHLLKLDFTRQQLLSQSYAATMPSLNEGNLLSLQVPVLPVEEQRSRATVAKNIREFTGGMSTDASRSIDLLTEYKTSLITAAVSGELNVTTAGSNISG